MILHSIPTGNFKLDGGAMFGVVPKSIWHKTNPADDNNLCTWAMRCLLVQDGKQLILIDNGIGDKQDAKFMGHYYLHGDDTLDKSLAAKGFSRDDITDVFLTHLHFDHCGGSIKRDGEKLVPAFKNAQYWSNEQHWKWATQPNDREKASFLKENILPIQESGQLKFCAANNDRYLTCLNTNFQIITAYGHTDAMMLPKLEYRGRTIIFMADLLPSVGHIPLPYIMAYDTRPLITLAEKKAFLQEAVDNNYVLFFEHDPIHECCELQQTEKGIRVGRTFSLSEL
jgi:glyoxylase-like metal-dependent hydrolase (beta-lactamase superfamily II)